MARVGVNHLLTSRFGPEGTTLAFRRNTEFRVSRRRLKTAAFPPSHISGLIELGSNSFLPSDEVSDTLQITDDFTKVYGPHSFKMGIEFQNVKFSTLQPAYSRGNFGYNSNSSSVSYTDIPNLGGGATGRAQFLLVPQASTVRVE